MKTKSNITEIKQNEEAERIVGIRKLPKNTIIFDQPCELNYHCPVCKYKNIVNGNYDQRLEWSEYNGFIWCSVCNKDYPTCFCIPNKDEAIKCYLSCIEDVINSKPIKENK